MAKDNKNNKSKPRKVSGISATFAELKQVSWPTFGQTMKRLAAVLVVSLVFLVVLMGVDSLLSFIHGQLFSLLEARDYFTTLQIVAIAVGGALVLIAIIGAIIYKVKKSKSRD